MACIFCNETFYLKVQRISMPLAAPLTPEQELRDKLVNMTGYEYAPATIMFCPMCGAYKGGNYETKHKR